MPLIKKKDVKNYFASRRRKGNHPRLSIDQPNVVISSEIGVGVSYPNLDCEAEESLRQPSSRGPDAPDRDGVGVC